LIVQPEAQIVRRVRALARSFFGAAAHRPLTENLPIPRNCGDREIRLIVVERSVRISRSKPHQLLIDPSVLLGMKFATALDPNNVANFKSSTLACSRRRRFAGLREGSDESIARAAFEARRLIARLSMRRPAL
jgi:hypothetical protein